MYYYGARYYDPRISIFVSVDPLAEQTMTPYQYVHNNPIMFTDPTGMSAEGDFFTSEGKKIGTDGINDGKKYILTNSNDIRNAKDSYFGKGVGGFFNKLFNSGGKGTIGTNQIGSHITLPSDTVLEESLNVLDRTIANGGLREESSIVMNDGTVIQGQTGSMPTIVNGVQIATASLPNLPAGTTPADAEATIHSHPTTVQQVGNQIYPQSASVPSGADRGTFSQYNTNIIVGPLGTVNNATTKPDGTLSIPNRPNGVVIYDRNTTPQVELTRKAVQKILKN